MEYSSYANATTDMMVLLYIFISTITLAKIWENKNKWRMKQWRIDG